MHETVALQMDTILIANSPGTAGINIVTRLEKAMLKPRSSKEKTQRLTVSIWKDCNQVPEGFFPKKTPRKAPL
jgi:hypothetical protein